MGTSSSNPTDAFFDNLENKCKRLWATSTTYLREYNKDKIRSEFVSCISQKIPYTGWLNNLTIGEGSGVSSYIAGEIANIIDDKNFIKSGINTEAFRADYTKYIELMLQTYYKRVLLPILIFTTDDYLQKEVDRKFMIFIQKGREIINMLNAVKGKLPDINKIHFTMLDEFELATKEYLLDANKYTKLNNAYAHLQAVLSDSIFNDIKSTKYEGVPLETYISENRVALTILYDNFYKNTYSLWRNYELQLRNLEKADPTLKTYNIEEVEAKHIELFNAFRDKYKPKEMANAVNVVHGGCDLTNLIAMIITWCLIIVLVLLLIYVLFKILDSECLPLIEIDY
jgi:hypothetical protein